MVGVVKCTFILDYEGVGKKKCLKERKFFFKSDHPLPEHCILTAAPVPDNTLGIGCNQLSGSS